MGKRRKGQEERGHRRQLWRPAHPEHHPAVFKCKLSLLRRPLPPRNPPDMHTERENQKTGSNVKNRERILNSQPEKALFQLEQK